MKPLSPARADRLLRYWFEGAGDGADIRPGHPCYRRWFGGGPALDAEISRLFASDMDEARACVRARTERSTPRQALARVLLLDQVPRHVHRGDARAFCSDADALALARRCIDDGSDERLSLVERVFLYLPVQHSECLEDHALALERFEALVRRGRENDRPILGFLEAALGAEHEHVDLLRRFGRYPGRNAALGRQSTPAERDWLAAAGTPIEPLETSP